MTLKIDTLDGIIDAFSSKTQAAETNNFSHFFNFTSGRILKNEGVLSPEIKYSGSKIVKNLFSGRFYSGSLYNEYTNYEKIKLESKSKQSTGLTVQEYSIVYRLDAVNTLTSNNETVSYDVFEKIDPNYQSDELEFKISLTSQYALAVVFAKAPPSSKVTFPEAFNEKIHRDDSFWKYSAASINEICEVDRILPSERVVYLRKYVDGVSSQISESGHFKSINLTSLGRDGRYAKKSEIASYLVESETNLESDSNGFIYNEILYPLKSLNSVIDFKGINSNNKVNIELVLMFIADTNQVSAKVNIIDDMGFIKMTSSVNMIPACDLSEILGTLTLASKSSDSEISINEIQNYTGTSSTTDPAIGNRYAPPNIFTFKNPLIFVDSSDDIIELTYAEDLIIRAKSPHSAVSDSLIYSSLDNAVFANSNQVTLSGMAKYGNHTFRAYVSASGGINESIVVEKKITVKPILPTPVFNYSTVGGILTISATSNFDILYSTDGAVPDLEKRTNVALYTRPFKIKRKIVIKAYAVFNEDYSEMVEYVFDPDVIFPTATTLATIGITGSQTGGVYAGVATVTLSGFTGLAYYTLNGTDPLDIRNIDRRVYTGPFNVLPIGSNRVLLNVANVRDGYRSISTYPQTPTIINFAFTCNPWKISDSSLNSLGAVVTNTGNLKLNNGTSLERSVAIPGSFYYTFKIKEVNGNSSLVFGMKSYLSVVNNLAEGEYTRKWPSPAITFIDRVGDIVTCNIGYRFGLNDKNNFDSVGSFDWNVTNDLPVLVMVKEDLIIPTNTKLHTASDLHTRIPFIIEQELDNLIGIVANPLESIVVSNIPTNQKIMVKLPDINDYPDGTKFIITKHGNTENSELIIACEDYLDVSGVGLSRKIVITDNSSVVIYKGDGPWFAVKVTNTTVYGSNKKMKLIVNGVETEYVPVSNKEIDNIMISVTEVNSENSAFVEIGNISGGCL